MTLGDEIAAAFNAGQEPPCVVCGGDGWYIGHEDECYDSGNCLCAGIQVECDCQTDAIRGDTT